MERQLQNPEFRINPENFHPCAHRKHFDKKIPKSTAIEMFAIYRLTHNFQLKLGKKVGIISKKKFNIGEK